MSFLGKMFGGGKPKGKAPTAHDAIQRLRDIEDILIKKQEYLEKKVESELAIARKNGTKNKRLALQALKRKKRYEKQLGQIDGTLTTIEHQREALENAKTNKEIFGAMDTAKGALQKIHGDMDVDKLHDMMDDIQEQQGLANEISEAISNPVGFQDVDEDELNNELDELLQGELDEKLLDVSEPLADNLPAPPSAIPVNRRKDRQIEDEDMRELAQWAS